jgi:hypothetical protein
MTTAAQRKQRSEKSVVIVERVVLAQLRAMGGWRFDLGVRRDGGQMVLREGHDVFAVRDAVKWLRHVCGQGCGEVAPSRKRQGAHVLFGLQAFTV